MSNGWYGRDKIPAKCLKRRIHVEIEDVFGRRQFAETCGYGYMEIQNWKEAKQAGRGFMSWGWILVRKWRYTGKEMPVIETGYNDIRGKK